jgi:type VI protein secretion system component VasK
MNNEFEWRNEMRKLGGAVEPARDLWPSIAARIAGMPAMVPARPRRRQFGWIAIAAAVIVAVGAGTTAYRWQRSAPAASALSVAQVDVAAPNRVQATSNPPPAVAPAADLPRTALDWAVPADPQLAASVHNLDTASAQLQDALEQHPDAVFLVGLLNRTNAQRLRLMRKSPYAG